MFSTLGKSLKNINYKLYMSLLICGLCPTIYTTLRVFFLGQLPGDWSFSIAGQLNWVNLIYEIIQEGIILPLYFFLGKVVADRNEFKNRLKSGLLITFGVYSVLSLLIIVFAGPLLNLMATDSSIINESITYIRIESVAKIFEILTTFSFIGLVTLNREKYVYKLTFARRLLSILFDTFLVSTLPISLNLGVNGIGYSNIIVNLIILGVSLFFLKKENINVFDKSKMSFGWTRELIKIGGISGLESFVRNIAYMLMIVRMVNVVNEQGVYWVANGFIWGWLLLPVNQLAEVIKQEIATDRSNLRKNTPGYFGITAIISVIWLITIPLWKPFMSNVLGYEDVDKLFSLVLILLGFYILYAFQNVFDATFYALGKTSYMLFESIVANTVYYGGAFILYLTGVFTPTLTGIALLFGIGMAFDSIVLFLAYFYFIKKHKSELL